ncbi:F-box/kelch-repeat protein At3g27150 [Ricinus communis]|uniref:Ubiquitin-protein ligase, putative n=1 Tax=Ricinus communis TaxID=3988 RepID=B9RBJ2_RICCO|nr:F-box/kelch-repeat protein At3g27150 [Ricinus communis]XP_025012213.1 F-box/kelch-repeat protein At3g27150 [Ricinus communis]EEF50913.1 ubiquitin-protein ligase, putative [Ricinus communis]|eukprot:XP_002509526.1 F-box/kelch-repeat protein At3g27150 [Ricinus communis]
MSKGKEIEGEDEGNDVCRNVCNPCTKGSTFGPGNSFWITSSSSRPKRVNIWESNRREDGGASVIRNYHKPIKKEVLEDYSDNSSWITSNSPSSETASTCETNTIKGLSRYAFSTSDGRVGDSSSVQPQDADYFEYPQLSDEVENQILARVPRSEYWKFPLVNKRIYALVKSGELFKIRRELGVRESSVFMFTTGDSGWWAFDRQFSCRRKLPDLPADPCFSSGDKETVCAGTHLIISGREINGVVVWRYELETNRWRKGPSMIKPRCLFASASCGLFAFVAGGVTEAGAVLNSAEKYNPDTRSWETLPRMQRKRRLSSGCYMDNKFYVIGGRNEEGRCLTCGEAYDEDKKTWELIPDMLEDTPVATYQSPPLVAVVNNELYSLETSSNELKVYSKRSKTWRKLGPVPVRADSSRGWGVAFKSLGNELLVIGASTSIVSYSGDGMAIYTCCPDDKTDHALHWTPLECGRNRLSNFILNCSVMVA